ncbi:MAG: hypothetical protein IPM92_08160 [Saprospiraceae bacterium]|nr:hypothetical protein [Saprospiraceae bacterium]
MRLISSSMTLVLRIFIPVFWMVFFGCLCLFAWITDDQDLPLRDPDVFRLQLTVFFGIGCLIVLVFLYPLKRVELDDEYFYITNFFKTVKLPINQNLVFTKRKFLGRFWVTMRVETKNIFGNKIKFVCNQQTMDYLENTLVK